MVDEISSAADPPAQRPARCALDIPGCWWIFVRVFIDARTRDGVKGAAEIVRSFCEASEMQPREVIARLRTYLLTDSERMTLH